jgi:hypothetical protein
MGMNRGRQRLVAVAAMALLAAACAPKVAPPPPPPPTVIVYGDSLTNSSKGFQQAGIASRRPGWRIVIKAHGGTALCDWLPQMQADSNLNAKVVVIQFSGNNFTPCMAGLGGGSPELLAKYGADAETAASLWASRGVKVVFVGNPMAFVSPEPLMAAPHPLDAVYAAVAARWAGNGHIFSDAPGLALAVPDPTSGAMVYPFRMPCLPHEAALPACTLDINDNVFKIQVRDGAEPVFGEVTLRGHFCPITGASPCPVYASGAWRFGDAIASAAAALMV